MTKYDIYLADVPFKETDEHKLRPILILNDAAFVIGAMPITSQGKTGEFQSEIQEWESAGLTKPSYIVLEPIRIEDRDMVKEKIGTLQPADIFRLEQKLIK